MGFSTGVGAWLREARADANKWDSGAAVGMVSSIFFGKAKGGGGGGGGGGGVRTDSLSVRIGLCDNFLHL